MRKKIVIAHAVKNEEELKKIKNLVKKEFPGAFILAFNYVEFAKQNVESVVEKADAVIISGYGRLIAERGMSIICAAREHNVPVYFVMKLEHDGLEEYAACLWAYRRTNSTYIERPVLTKLNLEDERHTEFYGKPAIILPTYAM